MDVVNKGIYQIRNVINGKVYIGSTIRNFKVRWKEHRSELRSNRHHSRHLQNAWNKYGESNFSFEIVEYVTNNITERVLLNKEQSYFDNRKPEYNRSLTTYTTFPKIRKGKTFTLVKNGISVTFTNLAKFCRENNLDESNLRAVTKGRIPDYEGYHLPDKVVRKGKGSNGISKKCRDNSAKANSRTFTLYYKNKKIMIYNLAKYCRENNLGESSMRHVIKGRCASYKDYTIECK